ncbi:MAG: SMC-Scp complex subunit ScpB [Pseudomonadota bacterium]
MSLSVVSSGVDKTRLRNIIEAALLAAGRPLTENALLGLFGTVDPPPRDVLREVLTELGEEYESRGIELAEVSSGWRIQVRSQLAPDLARLWESRPPRFSRALRETLCLIAYRQPITRGEIEDVRGVSVSVNIVRTLLDRRWVRVVGHRDVPGKPEMFGTTKEFLDYFGLKGLDDLPSLAELRDFDGPNAELDFEPPIDTQIALNDADADADGASASEAAEADAAQGDAGVDDKPNPLENDAAPEAAAADEQGEADDDAPTAVAEEVIDAEAELSEGRRTPDAAEHG